MVISVQNFLESLVVLQNEQHYTKQSWLISIIQ
jgi:hypothetical protein